jgi:hypothetical protein
VLEDKRQHLGAALEVGIDAFGLDDVTDDSVQIGAGGLGGIADPVTLEYFVIWDPNAAP